jgi:hypothetical protein
MARYTTTIMRLLHVRFYEILSAHGLSDKEGKKMKEDTWGRKKKNVIFTIQGAFTEKQFEKMHKRLLKIAIQNEKGYSYDEDDC